MQLNKVIKTIHQGNQFCIHKYTLSTMYTVYLKQADIVDHHRICSNCGRLEIFRHQFIITLANYDELTKPQHPSYYNIYDQFHNDKIYYHE